MEQLSGCPGPSLKLRMSCRKAQAPSGTWTRCGLWVHVVRCDAQEGAALSGHPGRMPWKGCGLDVWTKWWWTSCDGPEGKTPGCLQGILASRMLVGWEPPWRGMCVSRGATEPNPCRDTANAAAGVWLRVALGRGRVLDEMSGWQAQGTAVGASSAVVGP
jgi:hypothetical protein